MTDLDGRAYIDVSTCGIGATVLGYADPDVSEAAVRRVQEGSMCVLNPPDETALAAVQKHRRIDVPAHLDLIGRRFREGLRGRSESHGVPIVFSGHPCLQFIRFDHPRADALAMRAFEHAVHIHLRRTDLNVEEKRKIPGQLFGKYGFKL